MTKLNYNRPLYTKQAMNKKCGYPPMELGSILKFGKYRDHSIVWLIENDIKYLDWLLGEKIVELNNEAYRVFKENWRE